MLTIMLCHVVSTVTTNLLHTSWQWLVGSIGLYYKHAVTRPLRVTKREPLFFSTSCRSHRHAHEKHARRTALGPIHLSMDCQ